VNVRLTPEQILYTINHARAKLLLIHADLLPLLEAIRAKLTTVRQVVVLTETGTPPIDLSRFPAEYEALLARGDPNFPFPDFDENTRATTFYTTGTTGLPKGVYFSHRQLVLHTLATMATLGTGGPHQSFHRHDVYMPITPMFHVHAWGVPYLATLMGVKQVYAGRWGPDLLIDLKVKEGVTFSHCVPSILHMVLTAPKAKSVDLRGWKIIIGGSRLPTGLAQAALDRGIDVFAGYGLSETCPVLTAAQLRPASQSNEPASVLARRCRAGIPLPLVDLRLVDADMQEVPHDGESVGEVVVRAPWLTQGYLEDSASSERLWDRGYLHTQDIGRIDQDGYLEITDRLKDVIKVAGEWVSSLDLENLVSQHPAVSEVAVIAVKDEKWGERPLILLVPKPGAVLSEHDVRAFLGAACDEGRISRHALVSRVQRVEQIDKTSVGKINKRALRERFGSAAP
jgi:fatty-acyl-CoA synthase